MTSQSVLTIAQQALEVTVLISAPLLLTALAVGLLVSIFQAATQINEMTLSFIPKLLAMFGALILGGPWMLETLVDYIQRLYTSIPQMIG
ncbi:MAG: flagellar biosynthesis protein FliQ [Betaproteobacteria bacterium]|nr:flagellar biosynthesis protein FliQ [Betaproteobacteria bacterium]MBK6602814.1 flagellar biosynthesis protein FliQ [Betaproteobacteria bacterium]MBK7080976.1 flagellar biosynthesis protein FliQ [Betaproteobacteria bacterium]MBK7590144.1 flagellar biosynthesis protein FliQ [Betaproteobacteria bacterium]MBK7791239.1 flagellar biosynthesis protein FliQ [Betaproteobacteria bacterium]